MSDLPEVPERARFSQVVVVDSSMIDELHHVNNVVYLQLMEKIARAHSSFVGMDLGTLRELRCVPVARETRLKYHKPAFLGDELTIETRITRVQGVRAYREYEVRRGADLLVEGETQWVWLDPERGRPRAAVPDVLRAFGM